MSITCTIIKNGRADEYGRPLTIGQSYTGSYYFVKDLVRSGYASVKDQCVFDDDSTPMCSEVAVIPDGSLAVSAVVNELTGGLRISSGDKQYGLSPVLFPANGQIKYASYGDSISNVSSLANFDLRQITGVLNISSERMGAWIGGKSNGLIRLVANCGVSGETTTQMIAREAAGSSATRKAIADIVTTGAQYAVNSFGINDIKEIAGGAAQSAIDTVVFTLVSNASTLLKKQRANGIFPITTSLFGYREGAATASEIATRQVAVKQANTALSALINGAGGELGSYVDVYSLVADSVGAWRAGLDQGDGLHPGANGCAIIYAKVIDEILACAGVTALPKFAFGQQSNLFTNPDFSASAAGTATGLNIYTAAGTCTLAKSIVDWRGQTWQEVIVTPTALDGNGNAGVEIDITIPNTAIALNDVLGGEVSVYVDDGAGNAPPVFQWMSRLRANTVYADTPLFNPTISPKVLYQKPIDQRVGFNPIVSPAATPATCMIAVLVMANSLTPFRVRVALPRAFKLPVAY